MDWTFANLWLQVAGGFVGAHIAAAVVHDHSFGFIGHSALGLLAGALGGWFLQTQATLIVTGSGSLTAPRPLDILILEAVTGAVLGGIAMLFVGLLLKKPHRHDTDT